VTPPLPPQQPAELAAAIRHLAVEPPAPSLRHLGVFPPISRFLERFRAVLSRRGKFLFDREVEGLSRVEQAVAFLALLELRKTDEVELRQLAPFEPIAVCSNRISA
jgi:chromatin segregation and condensation protein Rec8/ScpA/Scc1 (kleisin family)